MRVAGRVAELADAKDLGSFGEILAGSTPVAPTKTRDGGGVDLLWKRRNVYLKFPQRGHALGHK